MKELMFV